ncbi:MAG: thiamine pyrophosphate-dependent enzyme [Deltaproteobacteria bacterium]|nr:thiamine pyrophosphate-dependent enzyme [Deltaproteobacteria bacterium]
MTEHLKDFKEKVLLPYEEGRGHLLPANDLVARSLVPPGTAAIRDFSHIGPELPRYTAGNCVACMECVTACPDTAILARISEEDAVAKQAKAIGNAAQQEDFNAQWAKTTKFHGIFEKKGDKGGLFSIYVDPTKCKGCGECVTVCGSHNALLMEPKEAGVLERYQNLFTQITSVPKTPDRFLAKKLPIDLMLDQDKTLLYVGGAGSCAGCGEATAIRMMLASTGESHGRENIGIVAATGCNTVYGSTYPYNPYLVTWANSLFENAPTTAMGVRARWDQLGYQNKRLWVLGGDGAMYDIGFQALSRMLSSGMDIKVLVLDTQVYSNTGGQTSTATFTGQSAKMSPHGKVQPGKVETRKELANLAMMHPEVYVAQTATAFVNHFYQVIREANEFPGPALVNVYTTCQPEHGVGDDKANEQAKRAVQSRAFPLMIHDPRKGESLKERLSLRGNPSLTDDWMSDPKTKELYTFVDFARSEGRFAKQFGKDGAPSPTIEDAAKKVLRNWKLLQELAGVKRVG